MASESVASERIGRVVIVGASIAGLATALALGQAGFSDVVVYERDPDLLEARGVMSS